jgi:3-demethoxyubiquinol 3-hydroxylase
MLLDQLINEFDLMLRTLTDAVKPQRPSPNTQQAAPSGDAEITAAEAAESIRLMRVNHVGEVCAQALYQGHGLATAQPELKAFFHHAAAEERDHLAWTKARLSQLGGRTSLLNPLWYAGAFGLGYAAGKLSDATSLALMSETERQVEAHLQGHLARLPANDAQSRVVVTAMQEDEARHGANARERGATELPIWAKLAMRAGARIMTGTARYI